MTSSTSILPTDSEMFCVLQAAASERRCVFFAGLPGVGKSLLLQQLAIIAQEAGRTVHLLQWDVARGPFETPEILARYPEVDGVTHAVIRKAAGLWARDAVASWHERHLDSAQILIGEVPLIGNRLIELVQQQADAVEPLLVGPTTLFLIPVPSREVRAHIEAARTRDTATPAHERERANADPQLVRALWDEMASVGQALGLPEAARAVSGAGFDPELYGAVYARLLCHRPAALLPVTTALPVQTSVYAGLGTVHELVPTPDDVARMMAVVEQHPVSEIEREVADWFRV
jgi:hypothetical protein